MPGGGVCAVLDYEEDMMAEYIFEMVIGLVAPQSPVSPSFRKFVSKILSSARLPRATILLGMNYFSKRINGLKAIGCFHPIERHVWQMFTIALLLGSKFLDDFTFQNRSWSEVSGISVTELNDLEAKWLVGIGWNLYVDLKRSEDYNAWLDNWCQWMGRKKMAQTLVSRERLAARVPPIDTDFTQFHNQAYIVWHQQQIAEHERLLSKECVDQPLQQAGHHPQEIDWNQYLAGAWLSALPTPPDSGYCTPEYPASATFGNSQFSGEWFDRAFSNDPQAQHFYLEISGHNIYHHGRQTHYPGYYNNYRQDIQNTSSTREFTIGK